MLKKIADETPLTSFGQLCKFAIFYYTRFIDKDIGQLHDEVLQWWETSSPAYGVVDLKELAGPITTPLWVKCEDETHTPKSGNLESSGTPENSELEFRGQNTSHWGVLYTIGKFLKCRCPKWPRMSHLDICSPSYGQKKGH